MPPLRADAFTRAVFVFGHFSFVLEMARKKIKKHPKRGAPWKSLGILRRVTNKGESGFGKASDRVKAEDHRP